MLKLIDPASLLINFAIATATRLSLGVIPARNPAATHLTSRRILPFSCYPAASRGLHILG